VAVRRCLPAPPTRANTHIRHSPLGSWLRGVHTPSSRCLYEGISPAVSDSSLLLLQVRGGGCHRAGGAGDQAQ
jgi:hypothetical protein